MLPQPLLSDPSLTVWPLRKHGRPWRCLETERTETPALRVPFAKPRASCPYARRRGTGGEETPQLKAVAVDKTWELKPRHPVHSNQGAGPDSQRRRQTENMQTHTHMHMHTRTHMRRLGTHMCTHVHTHIRAQPWDTVHAHAHTHVHRYTLHMQTHVHTCAHTHAHTHTSLSAVCSHSL